jgi:hypothetical protein
MNMNMLQGGLVSPTPIVVTSTLDDTGVGAHTSTTSLEVRT